MEVRCINRSGSPRRSAQRYHAGKFTRHMMKRRKIYVLISIVNVILLLWGASISFNYELLSSGFNRKSFSYYAELLRFLWTVFGSIPAIGLFMWGLLELRAVRKIPSKDREFYIILVAFLSSLSWLILVRLTDIPFPTQT